ncbi:MAG: hypothetical protein J7621_30330 [Niastella sp.]|nr:hypothetical protein [Niastella sp.]
MTRLMPGLLICLSMNGLTAQAQDRTASDSTGLPGDNFSLQGALELFKKAGSPEEFEKLLNTEGEKVNNLDLNDDGNIDYIRVINKKENDVQVFVLQALISDKESQDIAVIELEKTGKDNAVIQITGDEDIYGEETIIEPSGDDNAYNQYSSSLASGPNMEYDAYAQNTAIIVNVWAWPCVRFVYGPAYRVYVSPWGWAARPTWWRPWRPLSWAVYRPIRYRYRPHYVVVHTHRVAYARTMYRPMRVTSVTVHTRHQASVTRYRTTRTVTTARGRQYQATRKTTTVQGPRGNKVSHSKTTVRKRKR